MPTFFSVYFYLSEVVSISFLFFKFFYFIYIILLYYLYEYIILNLTFYIFIALLFLIKFIVDSTFLNNKKATQANQGIIQPCTNCRYQT